MTMTSWSVPEARCEPAACWCEPSNCARALLDQIAAHTESVTSLRNDIAASPFVAEVMVVSTCNRLEVTAEVVRFHGAVTDILFQVGLAKHTGVHLDELTTHLYVHFEERAVHHMFTVASGLDSMIVGEQQILVRFAAHCVMP